MSWRVCLFCPQKLLDSPDSGELHNRSKALHWLSEAARASHTESQFLLAQKLEAGSSPDPVAVFAWYTKAAQGGHAQAQYIVGLAHARDAVPTASGAATAATATSLTDRLAAAARWFSLSSEQGNVSAQARLGFMSYHGVGTARDEGAGLMWLSNAAEANQLDAQLLLGSIAFDEHERQQRDAPPAPGSKEEGKKLQTAKAYFDKVLENANKHVSLHFTALGDETQKDAGSWLRLADQTLTSLCCLLFCFCLVHYFAVRFVAFAGAHGSGPQHAIALSAAISAADGSAVAWRPQRAAATSARQQSLSRSVACEALPVLWLSRSTSHQIAAIQLAKLFNKN